MESTKIWTVVLFLMAATGIVLGIVALTRKKCPESFDLDDQKFLSPGKPVGALSTDTLPDYLDAYLDNYFDDSASKDRQKLDAYLDTYITKWLSGKGISHEMNGSYNKINIAGDIHVTDDLYVDSSSYLCTTNGRFQVGPKDTASILVASTINDKTPMLMSEKPLTNGSTVKMTAIGTGEKCDGNKPGPCYLRVEGTCEDCDPDSSSLHAGVYVGSVNQNNEWSMELQ